MFLRRFSFNTGEVFSKAVKLLRLLHIFFLAAYIYCYASLKYVSFNSLNKKKKKKMHCIKRNSGGIFDLLSCRCIKY